MRHSFPYFLVATIAFSLFGAITQAADPVFSGPQPEEKTTGFKVLGIGGAADGKERDPILDNAGAPTALVFIHTVERSMLPLLRVVEAYGDARKERLKTEFVFLAADRLSGEQRVRAVNGSLQLRGRVGLSIDGAEGPGNYGLNKECMMTIVIAKDNAVIANFALVQPGIADAPKVIAALAKTCGDMEPPTVEALTPKQPANSGRMAPREPAPKDDIPGAVPTDVRLVGLLREFIRPTNDEAEVNRVLTEVKAHIAGNPELKKQAVDGWTRVLHFPNYGTPSSRKLGQEFLESLKSP